MPTPEEIRSVVHSYVEMMCKSDIDGILALYADDATAEDPVGGEIQRGRRRASQLLLPDRPQPSRWRSPDPICVCRAGSARYLMLAELTMERLETLSST